MSLLKEKVKKFIYLIYENYLLIDLKFCKCEKCLYCKNYYGPNFDEPFCITCHYFIYPNIVEIAENTSELTSNPQISSGASVNNLIENSTNATNINEAYTSDLGIHLIPSNPMNIDALNQRNFLEVIFYSFNNFSLYY